MRSCTDKGPSNGADPMNIDNNVANVATATFGHLARTGIRDHDVDHLDRLALRP